MALVVEDGSIVAGAESYSSVADADAYNADYLEDAAWIAATTARKERALRAATQYVEARWGDRWVGWRVHNDQPLTWPRQWAERRDGSIVSNDTLPIELKRAVIELAIRHVTDGELLVDVEAPAANIKSERVKAGPVESAVEYWGGVGTSQKVYTIAERLLQQLLQGLQTERA